MNEDRIIQVIQCTKPMIAVYLPIEDDEYTFNWIYYLGLTLSGDIHPIALHDGMFDDATMFENYDSILYCVEDARMEPFYEHLKKWKENQREH